MAYEESLRSITLNADATLAVYTGVPGTPGAADPNGGHQYKFVIVTGEHAVGLADGSPAPIGVLQNKPQYSGNAATVAIRGVSRVVCGAAITAGAQVECNASGLAVTLSAGTAVGTALTTTANSGEIVTVLLSL